MVASMKRCFVSTEICELADMRLVDLVLELGLIPFPLTFSCKFFRILDILESGLSSVKVRFVVRKLLRCPHHEGTVRKLTSARERFANNRVHYFLTAYAPFPHLLPLSTMTLPNRQRTGRYSCSARRVHLSFEPCEEHP